MNVVGPSGGQQAPVMTLCPVVTRGGLAPGIVPSYFVKMDEVSDSRAYIVLLLKSLYWK
jgi:hypothetical protein